MKQQRHVFLMSCFLTLVTVLSGCKNTGGQGGAGGIEEGVALEESPHLSAAWSAAKAYDAAGTGDVTQLEKEIMALSKADIELLIQIEDAQGYRLLNFLTSNPLSKGADLASSVLDKVDPEHAKIAVNHNPSSPKKVVASSLFRHMVQFAWRINDAIFTNAFARVVKEPKAPLNDVVNFERDTSKDDSDARRKLMIKFIDKEADASVITNEFEVTQVLSDISAFAPQELAQVLKTVDLGKPEVAAAVKDFSCQFRNIDDVKSAFSNLDTDRQNNAAFSDLKSGGACTVSDITDNKIRELARGLGTPEEIRNIQGYLRSLLKTAKEQKDKKLEEYLENQLYFFNKGLFDRVIEELKSLGPNPQKILKQTKYGEMMKAGTLDRIPWWLSAIEGLDYFFSINEKMVNAYKLSGVKELYKTADDKATYMMSLVTNVINQEHNIRDTVTKDSHLELMLKNAVDILKTKFDDLKKDPSLKKATIYSINRRVTDLNAKLGYRRW